MTLKRNVLRNSSKSKHKRIGKKIQRNRNPPIQKYSPQVSHSTTTTMSSTSSSTSSEDQPASQVPSTNADTGHKGDKGTFADLLSGKTPGVRNIEKAYSRAGANNHHTPGYASKLGSQEQPGANEEGHQGVGSARFAERFSDQRVEVRFVVLFISSVVHMGY